MEDIVTKRIVVNMQCDNKNLRAGCDQLLSQNGPELFGAEKVVITQIDALALSSDAPQSISLGFNIGNGRADNSTPLGNSSGELYHPVVTDMSSDHQSHFDGYQNCVSVMPFEKYRGSPVACYSPASDMDDRMLKEYGAVSSIDELWRGVVPFSGEDYFYVEQGCTVDKVLARNWDTLGINRDCNTLIENKYHKIDAEMVNTCISQLYNSVISKIGITDTSNLRIRAQGNLQEDGMTNLSAEFKVQFKRV